MDVTEDGMVTEVRRLFLSALFPMVVTEDGKVIVFNELSENKKSLMDVTAALRVTDVNPVPRNADVPILVTEEGIVIVDNDLQF